MDIYQLLLSLNYLVAQTASDSTTKMSITGEDLRVIFACISAAITISIVGLAAAISEGYTAAKACEGVARNPESSGEVTRTMIVGQAVTESVAIYALVIAIIILFFMV